MGCDKLRHRKVPKLSLLRGRNQRSAFDPDESRYFVQFRHFCGATFWVKMGFLSRCAGSNVRRMHAVLGSFSLKTRPINCQLTGQKPVSSYLQVVNSGVLAAR